MLPDMQQLGLVCHIAGLHDATSQRSCSFLRQRIMPAILHRQIDFAFDLEGRGIAYWTWALLDPQTSERQRHAPQQLLHESEWNEGNQLWIVDFAAPFGYARDVVRHIRSTLGQRFDRASSARIGQRGRAKLSTWRSAGAESAVATAPRIVLRYGMASLAELASTSEP